MDRKNILVGPKLHLPVPECNLGQILHEHLKTRSALDVAFENGITGEWYSVGKVLEYSSRLAHALTDLGLTSDKVIAISANNHINYPVIILAALYAGVPLALMNPEYTDYELESLLKIVKPEIMFCTEMNVDTLLKAKSKCASLKKLVVIDVEQVTDNKDVCPLEKFLSPLSIEFQIKKINSKEQVAFLLFSSGTTGLPKAVAMTHYSMISTLIACDHPELGLPLKTNAGLGILPFFHIYGFYPVIVALQNSVPLFVMEHFNPFDYLKCIEKYKCTVLNGVPPLIHFLAKSPVIDEYDLSCLKDVTCGSAPIGEEVLEQVKSRLNLEIVRNAYGSTEAHMIVTTTPRGSNNLKSVGKVCPGTSICIRDLETGANLPANKQGQICIKSDMMMKGYYGNEIATKEAFTEDGWLKSGDIGYYDEEGYLYIVDRLKEFIKYKGFQVPPAELEAVLMTNPKIADAGVIGKPDQIAGELPVAFVVKEENADLNEDEVKSFVARFLSKHKHLHGVYFVDDIPRTRSGKIIRRELKKLLENATKSKL